MSAADTLVILGPVPPQVIDRARRDAARFTSPPADWPAGLTVVLQASSSLSQ